MNHKSILKSSLATAACFLVTGLSAHAAPVLIDFGTAAVNGKTVSDASNSTTGVSLTTPFLIDGGLLQITAVGGLFCDVGVTAATCGDSTNNTTTTAYGLGVGDGRIDGGETLTITPTAAGLGFTFVLNTFTLTGFSGSESAIYTLDGTGHTFTAPPTNIAIDSPGALNLAFNNSLTFGAGSPDNYSLASITITATPIAAPEPATFGLIGSSLLGLGFIVRRRRAVR